MIDVEAARQAYARYEISYIGLLRSEHNAADTFTKVKPCPALENLLRDGIMNHPVEEWVLRLPDDRTSESKKTECRSLPWELDTENAAQPTWDGGKDARVEEVWPDKVKHGTME